MSTCKKLKLNENLSNNLSNTCFKKVVHRENSISQEDYVKLKNYLREKKKILKSYPRVVNNARGIQSQINDSGKSESPLTISELNELFLYSIYGPGKYVPRWCSLEMQCNVVQTCILLIDGGDIETPEDFSTFKSYFPIFSKYNFLPPLEVELPSSWCIKQELEIESSENQSKPIKNEKHDEVCSKLSLLMSLNQLMIHNYPLPINKSQHSYEDFRFTHNHYLPVSEDSPMFAIDCEMCYTSIGRNELTRVSVVDEKLNVIYESLVKPPNKITNYLTQYSGITASKLNGVTTTLQDVQQDLIKLLPANAILVGQSLNCDLDALKLFHPYIIDTSLIFNLNGNKGSKSKLKYLAKSFLNMNIQCGHGHDSVEDSRASMLLVQLKLSNSLTYGDAYLIGQKRLAEFINTPIQLNNLESFKKFTVLLKCITDSSAQGSIHVKKQFMEVYDGLWSTKQFIIHEHSSNKVVLDSMCNSMNDISNKFCLAHMQLKNKKNLDLVNRWCEKYWAAVPMYGLCTVLFTGFGHNKNNSVCFLNVKQPPLPILKKDW